MLKELGFQLSRTQSNHNKSEQRERVMALETLSSSNDLLNFIIYETFSASTPNLSSSDNGNSNFLFENALRSPENNDCIISAAAMHGEISQSSQQPAGEAVATAGDCRNRKNLGVQGGRKKRRRRPRICKNKEETETQRLTHIVVERNRRKQMNEHLSVLRSLMPASYVQRGDQASIVGGAIEFVKELEHLLQSLEAQKFKFSSSPQQEEADEGALFTTTPAIAAALFSRFFTYPQYTWSQVSNKQYTSKSKASIADIEVTLIETHANLRILSRRSPKQLTKLAAGLQALHLTILHLNVTTMNSLVLYSISAKVEEGCQLSSVDDIAGAVHHMLRIIEGEAAAAAAASASSSSCQ